MKRSKRQDTVIRQDHRTENDNEYTYELTVRIDNKTASFKLPLYSIKINMTDSEGLFTTAKVKDLFADSQKAVTFYEKLVKHLATPIDLAYIVEDEMQ